MSKQLDLLAVVPPGQLGISLQPWTWTSSPGHPSPAGVVSLEGAGLEQERRRVLVGMLTSCEPAMHEPEHVDQTDQPDHPP